LPRRGRSTRFRRRDEEGRVDGRAVEIDAPVQVRAGGAAAAAGVAEALAAATFWPTSTRAWSRWQTMLTKPWPWSTKTVFPLK
jgi:hypothetical protein